MISYQRPHHLPSTNHYSTIILLQRIPRLYKTAKNCYHHIAAMSCGPACVCHPQTLAPTVALKPRIKARKLPIARHISTVTTKPNQVAESNDVIQIETLSGGDSRIEELPRVDGPTCAACCAGVSFDLTSIVRLPIIPDIDQGLSLLKKNSAFAALEVDLSQFEPGAKLTSVPSLPSKTVSFGSTRPPISPPATPRNSDEYMPRSAASSINQKRDSIHPPDFVQPHPPHKVFSAPIIDAHRMTRDGASKRVYHMSIDVSQYPLPPGEHWLVGGSFGVCAANDQETVLDLLRATGDLETAYEEITVRTENGRWPTVWGEDEARTLTTTKYDLVKWCSDVSSSPIKKNVLRIMAEYTTNELERQILLYLVSKQGQAAFCNLRGGNPITLSHLLTAFESSRPPLSYLLSVLPQLMPRWYSLSSDPTSNHGSLDFAFTVAEVPHYHGHQRAGLGSGFLEVLANKFEAGEKGLCLPMFRGLHANPFTKDFADTGPMILIGAGVGIAPFRGFVQRRVSSAKCAGKVYVIQGCRDSQFDGIYGNDLQSAQHCIVESQTGRKEYVQDEVVRQGELIWRVMNEEGGRVYVCGAAKGFLQGIEKALRRVAVQHGKLSDEGARDIWKKWQDPLDLRLILEVW